MPRTDGRMATTLSNVSSLFNFSSFANLFDRTNCSHVLQLEAFARATAGEEDEELSPATVAKFARTLICDL